MNVTVVRYMCPVCFSSVLGDVGESILCACGEKMTAVSASVLDGWHAERLLHKEQVHSRLLAANKGVLNLPEVRELCLNL